MSSLARLVRFLPRQFLFFSAISYAAPIAFSIFLVFLAGLNNGRLDAPEIVLGVVIATGSVLLLPVLKPKASRFESTSPASILSTLRNGKNYTLVAFESDFCAACMATDARINAFEEEPPSGLNVLRLIIQREPGRELFKQFDGRMTPTYMLFDPKGEQVEEWVLSLPMPRVIYTVRQNQERLNRADAQT